MISLSTYAKHKGVTLRAVQKAIEANRIQHVIDKNGYRKIIDIEQADRDWAANTDSSQKRIATKEQRSRGVITPTQVIDEAGSEFDEVNGENFEFKFNENERKDGESDGNEEVLFSKARAKRENFEAKLKELEFKKRSGLLVETDLVKSAFFVIAKQISENMLNITPRIASNLAACESEFEVTQMLDSEIRKALEGLANGKINI